LSQAKIRERGGSQKAGISYGGTLAEVLTWARGERDKERKGYMEKHLFGPEVWEWGPGSISAVKLRRCPL